MMDQPLLLISHLLCPYVQRAAIMLAEKGLPYERRDVDLANKPDWFLKISPLGQTPVLCVGDDAIFESAVICEFLDDAYAPRMHPDDPLQRARHRSWMAFSSSLLGSIGGFYNAADAAALAAKADDIRKKLNQLEGTLQQGPWFAGDEFGIVDAAFGPVFRYFDVFETIPGTGDFGFFKDTPKLDRWRAALAARPSVQAAVRPDYPQLLQAFLRQRKSALSLLM